MPDGFLHLAFLGPGGGEMVVVMLVLLLLFGSKDAPRIFRKLNEFMTQIRRTAENFKREVMYGDLHDDPHSKPDVGEYDDYGVSAHHGMEPVGTPHETAGEAEGPGVRPDASGEPIETEDEDGDVPKG